MFSSRRGRFVAASAVFVSLSCAAGGGNPDDTGGNLGSAGFQGAGGGQGVGGLPPNPGAGGGTLIVPIGTGGIATGPDGSCFASGAKAERIVTTKEVPVTVTVTEKQPVALYLMQDQSGSMLVPTFQGLQLRWEIARLAVQTFTNDPQSAGLDIGLQFFALPTPACDGSGGYAVPEVPIGRLPAHAPAINNAYLAHFPATGTPIEPALRGAVNFCLNFESTNAAEECVAVLITDGAPSDCEQNATTLAAIAGDAFSKGVMTYAIGMEGADFPLMDGIAIAGGTDCSPGTPGKEACDVSPNSNTSFTQALDTIRKTVSHDVTTTKTITETHTTELACDFKIPAPPPGQTFDPDKVNVHFLHGGADDAVLQVPSEADCAKASDQGWFYDNPSAPTSIKVCNGTCASIKASSGDAGVVVGDPPEVRVLLGCETDKAPLH
jgi:hypothetical protein